MMKPKQFLKTLAPDFCWCTWHDLYLMYEQINEDICENSFAVALSQCKDLFYRKQGHSHHKHGFHLNKLFIGQINLPVFMLKQSLKFI